MSTIAQGLALILLAVIAVAVVVGLVLGLRTAASMRRQQEHTHQVFASRDLGPVLHGLVQQTRDINRLLATIDKRLEKLEALEKIQIANMSLRDEPRSRQQ